MFDKTYDELNLIDKTPLKENPFKGAIEITDELVVIKKTITSKIASYFFTILIVLFWIFTFNKFYHSNFYFFTDEESTFVTVITFSFAFLVTLINFALKKSIAKESFINKKTGESTVYKSKKKKLHFNDVIGLQLLSYLTTEKVYSKSGSSSFTFIVFEINLITTKKKRVTLFRVEENKQKAISIANKLSDFFEKPLIVDLREEEKREKATRTYNLQKNGLIVSADVVTSIKSLNNLLNSKEFNVTKTSDNTYTIDTIDPFLFFLNLPKKMKQINASFSVYDKTEVTANVKIKTNFRYDLLLCFVYIGYFFSIIVGQNTNKAFLLSIILVIAVVRIFNVRAKENEFMSKILAILLPENENMPKIKFNEH